MSLAQRFPEIVRCREPLAPYTHLRIGGVADYFVQPRSVDELRDVLLACRQWHIPIRMLGGGYNLLVRDDPIAAAVIRLTAPAFTTVQVQGKQIRAGGGGSLWQLIAASVRAGLAGLETLVGLRGTVGGSVRCNVGDRTGEIATVVREVTVMTEDGTIHQRQRGDLRFAEHSSDIDEPVILSVLFELETEQPTTILQRMRKAWIVRKAQEPWTFQAAVRLFRNPPGTQASTLIDRAGLAKTRVGCAELSERNSNYVVAHPGTTAADILKLLELVRSQVKARTGVWLEQELHVW
ncbi:MAG: UDP-N-acetylmuramate dehydrogenase [Gemmataceae bacterium]|nr:UDP-N-acetylmuramate dehydrogenase [Gemmataceae bacterium]MCS7270831.1 UDP-N-acetylmuramate dehydrogenase [Gemmataceae bacterium]MDW8243422.1 UDP-N-acetylmuramate dehydrogenase [Thermogemmata sp.]